jgi:hypothetical protein
VRPTSTGVVNYAVPAAQLDAKTRQIAERLLKRNAYALALTKRVLNKQAMASFNLLHDAGARRRVPPFLHADAAGQGVRAGARGAVL